MSYLLLGDPVPKGVGSGFSWGLIDTYRLPRVSRAISASELCSGFSLCIVAFATLAGTPRSRLLYLALSSRSIEHHVSQGDTFPGTGGTKGTRLQQ